MTANRNPRMLIKNINEQEIMRQGGAILAKILKSLSEKVEAGVTTGELNHLAEKLIAKESAAPAFNGYEGFPASICVSVNEEVVHGIPGKRKIKTGDLVSLDLGIKYKGFYTDAAITVPVLPISPEAHQLLDVTKKSLDFATKRVKPGVRLGDIQAVIQNIIESAGFSVIRELVGHGIGRELHEEPMIPNFGRRGTGPILKPGMTICLEPMVSAGSPKIKILPDGWTVVTKDKTLAAHFEHTILVTQDGAEVLTRG